VPEKQQHKLKVLFVDDESAIRDIMAIELPRMGHQVTVCSDGEKAIAALDKQTFDAAIIDLRRPGIDGWGVVDHLKKVTPGTEFVISTGHGDMNEAIQVAGKIPGARFGCVEVRPIAEDAQTLALGFNTPGAE